MLPLTYINLSVKNLKFFISQVVVIIDLMIFGIKLLDEKSKMNRDDFWIDRIKGDWWCVYHVSMEKPIACFPKKKQATIFMEKEIKKHLWAQ